MGNILSQRIVVLFFSTQGALVLILPKVFPSLAPSR